MKREYNTEGPNFRTTKSCKECGELFKATANSKYCSTLCLQRNEYTANMLKPEWRVNKLLAGAKNRAKSKNLPFDLTLDYLMGLWDSCEGSCVISKRTFDLSSYGKKRQVNPNAPSIDRIIPEKGYIKGNVRLVTYHVNVALSEFGEEVLISLSKDIVRYA